MSEQPVPDSGYAVVRSGASTGLVWQRRYDGKWGAPGWDLRDWATLELDVGPMTPLLPAVRPDGVPDNAVPFVGWVAGTPKEGYVVMSPNSNQIQELDDLGWMHDLGLPVPAAPAPSLPERLREYADQCEKAAGWPGAPTGAPLIREAADALEAGSQS